MIARTTRGTGSRWPLIWLALLWQLTTPALAWNAAGHRLIAYLAWESMDPTTRSAVAGVLRRHPDFARWQARAGDADPDLGAFLEASTWPDDIRHDRRFFSAGLEEPTPALPGFPDMERRLNWHYVDRPPDSGQAAAASAGQLDRQLVALAHTLADPRSSVGERAYALPWLIHLVGDAHQPLHAASRYGSDGQGDSGGNAVEIVNPFQPHYPSTNLHRYWDELPGPPWLRGRQLQSTARSLSALYQPPPVSGTPAQWIAESRELARTAAYPPAGDAVPTISATFHANSLELARRRVVEAGYRLAEELKRLFADHGGGQ